MYPEYGSSLERGDLVHPVGHDVELHPQAFPDAAVFDEQLGYYFTLREGINKNKKIVAATRSVKLDELSAVLQYIILLVRWCFILI